MSALDAIKEFIMFWDKDEKGKRAGSPKASDYLVVENPDEPSTWHLPVKENGTPNHRLMGAAWAALHGGYRGNAYSGPSKSAAIKKLRALYHSEGLPLPGESKEGSFTVWKQLDGTYRWFSVFSNPYRDRDNPPEILTEAAQIDFSKAVNDNSWPYPELWLWHIPGSKCGTSDFIAYDIDNRLSLASGTFDKGKEIVAEALNSTTVELKTSHGMPRNEIHRDPEDRTILTRFRSKEISPLPADAAANEITPFVVLGGTMKLVPESVKEKFSHLFPDEETRQRVEETLDTTGTEAKEKDLEFKEKDGEVTATEVEPKAKVETEEVETEEQESKEVAEDSLDRKEIEDAITLISKMVAEVATSLDTNTKAISQAIETMDARLAKLEQSDEAKIAAVVKETPRLSFSELVLGQVKSVIGKEATRVDGRTTLGSDSPKETEVKESIVFSGSPLFDEVITDIATRGMDSIRPGGSDG